MKIFFVCKHFTYVSVTNRIFFWELRGRGGNMNSTPLFCHLSHYIIWYEFESKKWATHTKWTMSRLLANAAPFGPVNFMKKSRARKNRIVEMKLLSMVHHFQLVSYFWTRFNEFRSPNKFPATFFYGQLTCISIDIQNLFFICVPKKKCMHTSAQWKKIPKSSRSSTKLVTKNCFFPSLCLRKQTATGRKKLTWIRILNFFFVDQENVQKLHEKTSG